MEDDLFYRTDEDYSFGSKIFILFSRENLASSSLHIPFTNYKQHESYISFALSTQIYTPENLSSSKLIQNDRPYAGYAYFESAFYQSYQNTLYSLAMQIGAVGDATHMDALQEFVHRATDSEIPEGWDNQLSNELILQVNYNYKKHVTLEKFLGLESVIIPEFGFNLGNASTKAYLGTLLRYGWGIPKNYGAFTINDSTYSQVPLSKDSISENFLFCFNVGVRGNGIARDIFLDGNSNVKSHSVEKNNFTLSMVYGFSFHYANFSLDWVHNYTTREYVLQDKLHKYTSFQFSYDY